MGVLALSRCGDAFSLDRLVRARRHAEAPPPSGEYRWPARMILLVMSCVFFAIELLFPLSLSFPPWHRFGLANPALEAAPAIRA